jgi:hypothetical protein
MGKSGTEKDARAEKISDAELAKVVGGADKGLSKPVEHSSTGAGLGAGKAEFDDFE